MLMRLHVHTRTPKGPTYSSIVNYDRVISITGVSGGRELVVYQLKEGEPYDPYGNYYSSQIDTTTVKLEQDQFYGLNLH